MTLDPTYPFFPVIGFISCALVLVPLPWHIRAMNTGTTMFMLWSSLYTFCQALNAVLWRDDYDLKYLGWCDFSTRVYMAASFAVPCCCLCIQRRLHNIAVIQSVTVTRSDKIRNAIFDLVLTLLLPMIYLVFYYIVEGHRADILEEVGCRPTIYNTAWAYVLVYVPPFIPQTITFCYAAFTLRAFIVRRAQFMDLMSTNSNLNFSQYTRLMLIAIIEMCLSLPFSVYFLYINTVTDPIAPWYSWDYVHYDWSFVLQIPAVEWRSSDVFVKGVYVEQWMSVASCLIFFALFGFAEESRKYYRQGFWAVSRRFGFTPKKSSTTFGGSVGFGKSGLSNMSSSNGGSTLPVFISQRKVVKRDSFLTSAGELTTSFEVEVFDDVKGSVHSISESSLPSPEEENLPQLPEIFAPARPIRSGDLNVV